VNNTTVCQVLHPGCHLRQEVKVLQIIEAKFKLLAQAQPGEVKRQTQKRPLAWVASKRDGDGKQQPNLRQRKPIGLPTLHGLT
jgi:hypothetical protein